MTSVVTASDTSAAAPAPGFEHDAFISYSRKDKAFAAALEKALEDYRPLATSQCRSATSTSFATKPT